MKKLIVLFTLVALAGLSINSMATDPDDDLTIECALDGVPGGAYLTIAGKFGGEITKSELAKVTSLEIQGCAAGAKIFQFVLVVKQGRNSQSFRGESGNLTKEMHQQLQALTRGDEFSFKDVKAHLDSKTDVDVWAKKFVII